MTKPKPNPATEASGLRRRAEAQPSQRLTQPPPQTEADIQRLVHELQVHQIELEMQNEELRQTRAELLTSLERYTDLYDFAPVGYFTLAQDGTVRQANLSGARLLGVERSRLEGARFGFFVADAGRPAFNAFLKRVFGSRSKETCEVALCITGEASQRLVHIEAVIAADGHREVCSAAAMDITERKRSEMELSKSEKHFRTLFEQAAVGVTLIESKTGRYLDINQKYCDFLGYTKEELLNLTYHAVTHPGDVQENVDNIALLMTGKIREYSIDKRFIHKDGRIVWGNLTVSPLWAPGEEAPVYQQIAVVQDITERKQLTEQLIQSQKLAGLGTLAAGVAHEVNSPLQVITGSSQSILKRLSSGEMDIAEALQQVEAINRNAWRIADMTRSLRAYIHDSQIQFSPASLNTIVRDVLLLTEQQLLAASHIEVVTQLAEGLPDFICDAAQMSQVLISLLTNAGDAMPDGGTLTIRTGFDAPTQRLALAVSDTGHGIPEANHARIFDPFFTTRPPGQGAGLGLSIVTGIVQSHGGEIRVDSQPGKGAVFSVFLPLNPPAVESPTITPSGRYDA